MIDNEPDAKVMFRVEVGDGSIDVETHWTYDPGDRDYRLDNSPFYAGSGDQMGMAPHGNCIDGIRVSRRVN